MTLGGSNSYDTDDEPLTSRVKPLARWCYSMSRIP